MKKSEGIITLAVERLNGILPLAKNQHSLSAPFRSLHRAILRAYIDKGRTLIRSEMAQYVEDLDGAVNTLKRKDLVVLNDLGEPTGAYPFTMEERIHSVSVNNHVVHCMCALDALAVSPMFNLPAVVTSRCNVTNDIISIQQHGLEVIDVEDASSPYIGINWGAASGNECCADSLCTEMVFLKNKCVAEHWLADGPDQQQIFPLGDAVDFAARFFSPLVK